MGRQNVNAVSSQAWTMAVADATDVTSGLACRIHAVLLTGGVDAATLILYDAATATGTDLFELDAAITTSVFINLGQNGTRFDTGTDDCQYRDSASVRCLVHDR